MRKKRQGLTNSAEGLTHPDIIDKLTDKKWRSVLEALCYAFEHSHHPEYKRDVYFLDDQSTDLETACNYLGVTG